MRREWIEILDTYKDDNLDESPSMRREWIEIRNLLCDKLPAVVSLHAEGVD